MKLSACGLLCFTIGGCESVPDLSFADAATQGPDGASKADGASLDSSLPQPDANPPSDVISTSPDVLVAPDANSCVLPPGATLCCGAVACTNHDGSCTVPAACDACQATCIDPRRPLCCANGGAKVACVASPGDC